MSTISIKELRQDRQGPEPSVQAEKSGITVARGRSSQGSKVVELRMRGGFNSDLHRMAEKLRCWTQLTHVDVRRSGVTKLDCLLQCPSLTSIDAQGTKIQDLKALWGVSNLKSLNMSETAVMDLKPLRDSLYLRYLRLACCAVEDVGHLRNCSSLQYLDLKETFVVDLRPLVHLPNLEVLRTADGRKHMGRAAVKRVIAKSMDAHRIETKAYSFPSMDAGYDATAMRVDSLESRDRASSRPLSCVHAYSPATDATLHTLREAFAHLDANRDVLAAAAKSNPKNIEGHMTTFLDGIVKRMRRA